MNQVRILGIETSCDETAVSVVEDGHFISANVIASQVELHARYGGIVPEVASRQHLLQIVPTLERALFDAEVELTEIDAIAVTYGPGLVGALMVGVNMAKALAFARGLPLVGVQHLEGHVFASWLGRPDLGVDPGFPLVCLIASGAHTDLVLMHGYRNFEILGRTRDDAAGEAFDKAARVLGLGFPGGPEIQRVAAGVSPLLRFPRAWLGNSLDFSFSGLKTALLHRAQEHGVYPPPSSGASPELIAALAAAFQEAVVDVMIVKALQAVDRHKAKGLILGGGVAANAHLRNEAAKNATVPLIIPAPILCTDNGAMIAAAGYFKLGAEGKDGLALDAYPTLPMTS